ncbi:MAG TPA: hypothetical protein H9761_17125 [Candidatus Eisenbergiella merdavium]|uniref:Uncharacterized protein n=1 Tax=Candidatus Eisenbergiella merdavium TaxID=2838551 RepID=A0A9D2SRB6_9FIRM|nr:hypothetical protein [Candidatus Eisenbergiella merdavium]
MEDLRKAWEQAWSLENIDAHEEAGKATQYIGSMEKGRRIYDFFQDDTGHYWYKVRIRLTDGQAVSEENAIFGHAIRNRRKRR